MVSEVAQVTSNILAPAAMPDSADARSVASRAIAKRDRAAGAAPPHPSPDSGFVLLWIVRIGLCLVLMTPLIVIPHVIFPFVVGKALFARSIIEVTFAFWAALVLFHPRRRPSRSRVIAAFAVWLLVSCIAAAFGVSPTRSVWSTYERMQGAFDLAHWFAFTLMAGSVFRSAADWRLPFGVSLVFGATVCVTSLAHHYGLVDVGPLGGPGERIGSTLGNPLFLGAYVMVNALISAALFVWTLGPPAGSVVRRIGGAAAGGLCALLVLVHLWTMWLSGTRSAIAGLGAASVVFAAYAVWGGPRVARRTAAGAVLAVLLSAAVLGAVARTTTILDPIVEQSVMLRRMSDIGADSSVRWRFLFAEAGLRAFRDRPVLGWGPENFIVAWGRYISADTDVADHAHNKLVEEVTTKGLLGLLSYLALWAVVTSATFRALGHRSGRDRLHVLLVGASLAAWFVQSLFQVDNPVSMMQFSLLIALAASVEASGRTREQAGGADSPRQRVDPRATLDRIAGLPATPVRVGSVLVVTLAMVSLAYLNVQACASAAAAAEALVASRPWSDRQEDFLRSIRGSPCLANQPRMYFMMEVAADLDDLSEEDFQRRVVLVTREIGRGSTAEPQNWLLEAHAATFYQMATIRDRKYLDIARRHVDRAAELAPGVPGIVGRVDAQERLEAGTRR